MKNFKLMGESKYYKVDKMITILLILILEKKLKMNKV